MSASYRRFEILLPLRFNDGQPVPEKLIADALLELRNRFGAVSAETQITRGQWLYEDQVFRDDLIRVYVDIQDSEDSRQFFAEFKERAKANFMQVDLWMTTYPIEVLESDSAYPAAFQPSVSPRPTLRRSSPSSTSLGFGVRLSLPVIRFLSTDTIRQPRNLLSNYLQPVRRLAFSFPGRRRV